jgi:hypothetical protein
MKPIPEALRAYFPTAPYPERPWWKTTHEGACMERSNPNWSRTIRVDRMSFGATVEDLLQENDNGAPLPPPPILVGQVWSGVGDDGAVTFEVLTVGTARDRGGVVYAWGLNVSVPVTVLIECGYLLRCPFGCAPWSGPEVP